MNLRTLKSRFRNRTWIFLKAKWRLLSGLNIIIENDSDWFVYNEIFVNKEYDEALRILLSQLREEEPLILDLGANVGYFTLKIADELIQSGRERFRILALEAAPDNHRALLRRMAQDRLNNKVTAVLGLAGYKTGAQRIHRSEQHYGHSSSSGQPERNSSLVNYVNIEEMLPDRNKRISFLKCDIEGSEEIFLREYSELMQRVELAVFEFHALECNVENCRQLLRDAGFCSLGVLKEDPAFKTLVEVFKKIDTNTR